MREEGGGGRLGTARAKGTVIAQGPDGSRDEGGVITQYADEDDEGEYAAYELTFQSIPSSPSRNTVLTTSNCDSSALDRNNKTIQYPPQKGGPTHPLIVLEHFKQLGSIVCGDGEVSTV